MDIREFERNKYYYGKLLTVTDFEIEQQYYLKRAKLLNRIIHGVGIISGLQVTQINETQLAVESGVAMDYEGNLILIPVPLTVTLSGISGYLYDGPVHDEFYLCLRYKEKERDAVQPTNTHALAQNDEITFNHIIETYELYLRQGLTEDDFGTGRVESRKKTSVKHHFDQSMNELLQYGGQNCICLAKIRIQRLEKSGTRSQDYYIEEIEGVPFNQFVYNQDLMKKLVAPKNEKKNEGLKFSASAVTKEGDQEGSIEVDVRYDQRKQDFNFEFCVPKGMGEGLCLMSDTVEVVLKNHLFSDRVVTEEIEHGLGKGPVCLHWAVEDKENWYEDGMSYFGDLDVFADTEEENKIKRFSIGCVLYPNRGTFKIGIKYNGADNGDRLTIRWWAFKAKERRTYGDGEL